VSRSLAQLFTASRWGWSGFSGGPGGMTTSQEGVGVIAEPSGRLTRRKPSQPGSLSKPRGRRRSFITVATWLQSIMMPQVLSRANVSTPARLVASSLWGGSLTLSRRSTQEQAGAIAGSAGVLAVNVNQAVHNITAQTFMRWWCFGM
jgi:hypothetical protein